MFANSAVLGALILVVLSTFVQSHDVVKLEARRHKNSTEDRAPKLGAVASESAVCSRIGTNLLEKGGNAADAVCAA